jgi:hypothetical protein
MNERIARLESALRAQEALIGVAQAEITPYLSKETEAPEFIDRIIRLFDGPEQREAQRLASGAFGEDFLK